MYNSKRFDYAKSINKEEDQKQKIEKITNDKQKTYTCNRQNAHTKYSLALHLQQDNDMYFRNRIHIILRIQCLFLDIVCPIPHQAVQTN